MAFNMKLANSLTETSRHHPESLLSRCCSITDVLPCKARSVITFLAEISVKCYHTMEVFGREGVASMLLFTPVN